MLPLNYFLFLQIILFLFITPGPPRIVIVSYSMNYGVQKCVWTALGDITANIIQATLVIFVIGSFFSENPNFLNFFKWIGVAYILYLAFDIYNSRPKEITTNYVVLDFLSLIGYALLAQKLINWINTKPRTINTISAGVLVIIAVIIVVTQQY